MFRLPSHNGTSGRQGDGRGRCVNAAFTHTGVTSGVGVEPLINSGEGSHHQSEVAPSEFTDRGSVDPSPGTSP